MVAAVSSLRTALTTWRPPTPPLPDYLARLVRPEDPEWFARELAIAAAPSWWFWRFMLRRFSWLVSLVGRVEVTGSLPDELRKGPAGDGGRGVPRWCGSGGHSVTSTSRCWTGRPAAGNLRP